MGTTGVAFAYAFIRVIFFDCLLAHRCDRAPEVFMVTSQEAIGIELLLEDIDGVMCLHCDLIASYEYARSKIHSDNLVAFFDHLIEQHRNNIDDLGRVIEHNGGTVKHIDMSTVGAKVNLMMGHLLNHRGVLHTLLTSENNLLTEYVQENSDLADLPGMGSTLENNQLDAEIRVRRLEKLLGNEQS